MTWAGEEATAIEADATDSGFAGFGLPEPLLGALAGSGITQPFPIQSATIPDALAGRDVLGRAQTGSGKTLGFGLPLLARLSGKKSHLPRGLVVVPTRELAVQVADALAPLARTVGLSVTLVAGGMPYGPQRRAFERGVDVIVATPGRMIDLLDQGACDLTAVEITVLDEADHMADLGFLPDVKTLLDAVPSDGQRLLFSATLDSGVDRLVKTYLTDPVTHQVDSDRASVTTMSHHVVHVQPRDKTVVTAELASREGRTVIFVRTQRGADRIAEQLRAEGVLAGALHGGLSQGARSRILTAFKEGRIPALVATDVAARGIHVDEVGLVLQVDPPAGPKDYLHRAGRTARAGGSGAVVTLVLPHQRRELDRLTRQAGVQAISLAGAPGDQELAAATGARTPSGDPVSEADYQRLISPPPKRRAGGSGSRPFRGKRSDAARRPGRSAGSSRRPERAQTWS
jgi:superfamily II DNA/RNA helicase